MKIVINDLNHKYIQTISIENLDNIQENYKQFSSYKEPLKVKIYAINESINSNQLLKFKNDLNKINNFNLSIFSNIRETILAGKSLKIDSTYVNEQEAKHQLILIDPDKKEDILHSGTVRSGDRISSNGNLCIIGDVNPGAIISAKKNIYVWGKLLGIAIAGKDGNKKAYIASLYLHPLQLRIADIIALGPKDKPKNHYPEIALLDKQVINIKPFLIETKN